MLVFVLFPCVCIHDVAAVAGGAGGGGMIL